MTSSAPIRWQSIALIGGVFVLYFLTIRSPAPPEGWATDFDQAVAEAKASGKNLLVAFNLHGCPPCAMMDERVLPEARVRAAIEAFVPVRVSLDTQTDIARRFNVEGAPTYAVMTPDGTVLSWTGGYRPVEEFLAFLDQASTPAVAESQ